MSPPPQRCLVIEGSAAGIEAGLAAGMKVWRYVGGSHVADVARVRDETLADVPVFDNWEQFYLVAPEMRARSNGGGNRLDDAARAGWLYFVAGNTQDEIARKLGVSRQSAQRLVSLAVSEKLIKFRLDRPIARCMELSRQLSHRFGLQSCEIVPSDSGAPELITGVAVAGAADSGIALQDPRSDQLTSAARAARSDPMAFFGLSEVFGDLCRSKPLAEAFARQLEDLWSRGLRETLHRFFDAVEA